MPTPQNMTSLQSTACSVSGGFVKYSETINTFLPGQDFFYTQQNFDSKIFLVKYLTISLIKLIHAINYYILINVQCMHIVLNMFINFYRNNKRFLQSIYSSVLPISRNILCSEYLADRMQNDQKKSYDTKNDLADRNATNIYFWLTFYEMGKHL